MTITVAAMLPSHRNIRGSSSVPARATPKCRNHGEGRVGGGIAEEEVAGDDRIPHEEGRSNRRGGSNKKSKGKSSSDGEKSKSKSKSVNKPQEQVSKPQPFHDPNDPERWYKEGDALADADLETILKMTAATAADMRTLTFYPEGPCKTDFVMGENMVHAWQLTKFTAEMRTLHDQYLVASRNPQFFGSGLVVVAQDST